MPVIISHNSALERLRAVPPQANNASRYPEAVMLDSDSSSARQARKMKIEKMGLLSSPVHILVDPSTRRSESERVVTHSQDLHAIPPNLLLKVDDDLYASSCELCFLQMASSLTKTELIALGFELCGSYSHFAPPISGYYERNPLTTASSISFALDALKGAYGISGARSGLKWVLDGSASPMETVCACMLTLPNSMGGEGFIAPQLNFEVPLDEAGRRITGKKTCRIDMAWPDQMLGIEYNGADSHTDEKADRLRREALQRKGWTIFVMDKERLFTYKDYSDLLGLIDGKIPRRKGMGQADRAASKQLLNDVLAATRCSLGYDAVLFAPCVPKGCVKLHL